MPDETPSGAQGWFINTRRDKFRDPRVREALIQAFDFEWTNKTIMYGAYARTHSPFQNSDMMANGPPSPEELKLLEPFRGQVPDEVFGPPFVPPVSDGSGQDRTLLRKASQLLLDAGLVIKDGKRVLPNGEVFKIEFLVDEPSLQPHHAPYIKNLGTLGIEASLRLVDPVQYRARVEDFDFDMTIERFQHVGDAGRRHAAVLLLAGRRDQGIVQPRRHRQSGDRRADRKDHRRRQPRRSDGCLPRFRPGVSRRPLLGAAMVSRHASDRLLGSVRTPRKAAALCARRRRAGKLVDRPAKAAKAEQAK